MSRIRPLPEHLVNKIAAGEVVERPASVVKELVENAIDAEAAHVTVDLRDAGRQLIRVRDDGIGMTPDELGWALTRHATSKIATDADLDSIQTLGFRGEALPAIAAVSRFSLLSCAKGAVEGALLRGAAGAAEPVLAVAAPPGTTVEVQDLFFNTPARLKFLKAARTELAMALRLLQGVALAHPDLHLAVTHDGRAALTAPRARSLRERVGALYGWDLAARMLEVRRAEHGLAIVGLIAPPQHARASREEITWVVNGRPVRDTALTQTLLDAYRPMLARDQHPVAVVWIDLPPQELDVNVHPAKAWVRFRAPRVVQETLFLAVQEALRAGDVVQRQAGLDTMGAGTAVSAEPFVAPVGEGAATQPGLFREAEAAWPTGRFGAVVGQLQDTFVVAATEEEVFFVDQHVAHERVVFERLQAELQAGPLASQELLFPETLELPPGQRGLLAEWAGTLTRLGFVLEGFGGDTSLVRALPALLARREPRRLITRMLEELASPGKEGDAPQLERALAFVACRAAIKAPAPLEREEMRRLLADLSATRTPFFCPHGRPIVSRLSLKEIRKELRRTW
ncbi:MAG TPA: DNA mismatch repair endonuclease MutL [Methylomirabilota bacterium]|nr:DNA mismatch repair endonuclease MutL [Methylomirabilota bacterium]